MVHIIKMCTKHTLYKIKKVILVGTNLNHRLILFFQSTALKKSNNYVIMLPISVHLYRPLLLFS